MNMIEHRAECHHFHSAFLDKDTDNRDKYDKIFRTIEYAVPSQAFDVSMSGFHCLS